MQCTASVTLRDKWLIHLQCYHNSFADVTVDVHDYIVNKTPGTDHSVLYFQQHLYNLNTEECGDSGQLTKYESEHVKGRG